MFVFDGFSCLVAASAAAFWSESADCAMGCVAAVPALAVSHRSAPASAVCSVAFRFPAVASDVASFVCVTSPSSPGLRTRTEMFVFDGFSCSVAAIAAAF